MKQLGCLHMDMLVSSPHMYVITCGRLLHPSPNWTVRNSCLILCCQAGVISSGHHGHFSWLHHCFFLWRHHRGPVSPVMLLLVWALHILYVLPDICSAFSDCCKIRLESHIFGKWRPALFSRFQHEFFNGYLLIHVPFSPFCLSPNRHWLTCTYIMFAVPYFVYDIYAMFMCYWYKLQVKGHEDASATPKHMTSALTSYLRREFLMVLHHVVMVTVCFPVSVVIVTRCFCGAEVGRSEWNIEAGRLSESMNLALSFFSIWVTKMNWLLPGNVAKGSQM